MKDLAQELVEATYNYYGLKAELSVAAEYLANNIGATPGAFYDWLVSRVW